MTERSVKHEQSKSYWVPFREKGMLVSGRADYGQISWNPAYIPFGNEIYIDVAGANNWLHSLNINFPLELRPYTPPTEDLKSHEMEVNKKGEAALTTHSSRSKILKPKPALFEGDVETEKQTLLINFSGISDYIQASNPGISKRQFALKYGELVNLALQSQTGKLILYNYLSRTDDSPVMKAELISTVFGCLVALPAEVSLLAALASGGDLKIETATLATLMSATLFITTYGGIGTMVTIGEIKDRKKDISKKDDHSIGRVYSEYLATRDRDYPWKLMMPVQLHRYLTLPLLTSAVNKNLIKGADY